MGGCHDAPCPQRLHSTVSSRGRRPVIYRLNSTQRYVWLTQWKIIICWHLTSQDFTSRFAFPASLEKLEDPTWQHSMVTSGSSSLYSAQGLFGLPHSLCSKQPRQAFGCACPCVLVLGMGFVRHQTTWIWSHLCLGTSRVTFSKWLPTSEPWLPPKWRREWNGPQSVVARTWWNNICKTLDTEPGLW